MTGNAVSSWKCLDIVGTEEVVRGLSTPSSSGASLAWGCFCKMQNYSDTYTRAQNSGKMSKSLLSSPAWIPTISACAVVPFAHTFMLCSFPSISIKYNFYFQLHYHVPLNSVPLTFRHFLRCFFNFNPWIRRSMGQGFVFLVPLYFLTFFFPVVFSYNFIFYV